MNSTQNQSATADEECEPCKNISVIKSAHIICLVNSNKKESEKCNEQVEKVILEETSTKDYISNIKEIVKDKDKASSDILCKLEEIIK